MAQFHVGQRVRVIVHQRAGTGADPFGQEGVIVSSGHIYCNYLVRLPIETLPSGEFPVNEWLFHAHELVPLTDPAADRFIESIKKLGREPINDAPKVTVEK